MKRLTIFVVVILAAASSLPLHAQGGGARQTWPPYDFSFVLPDGWTASPTPERLVLGLPDDVSAINEGRTPAGTVVVVWVVEPNGNDPGAIAAQYSPEARPEVTNRAFGTATWPALNIPPLGDRQGMLVVVAQTFLVSASGPAADWQAVQPVIDGLIASVQASPAQRSPAERLTQPVQWRDLRFKVPGNWLSVPVQPQDAVVWTTYETRLLMERDFQLHHLILVIRDLSPLQPQLTLETALSIRSYWYQPDTNQAGPITTSQIGGFDAARQNFDVPGEGGGRGQAVTLQTPGALYLVVGMAGTEDWNTTDRDLFEAILATLEKDG